MEIFLILVLILLVVIFYTNQNTKLHSLQTKLNKLEDYLKSLKINADQNPVIKKTEIVEKWESSIKPIMVNPSEIKSEVIPPTVQPIITPIIKEANIDETKINDIKTEINITEAPIQQANPQPQKPYVPKESWYDKFRKNNPDLEKFIGENLVSKIGIAILVIGIAFFVKFAIDKEWINEIARVGIGILCGVIVLGFAHKLHAKYKAFSSVLVAGGISIFYFTIGIAFHQYHIFNQTTAFVIMLFITGFSVFTSVLYNRVELAALSLIGGFATPFMLSTGEGNYITLFVYVLILDIGMLVLAYLRKWNIVNVLAYLFTIVLYVGWLQGKVIHEPNAPYKGAFIFGSIFYFVFIIMNVINNIKEKRKFGTLELSVLISNTFIFYGTGMQILSCYHPELQGLYSILMGLFNLICSWLLFKKFKADEKLVYLMIGLTLTFITLAAPIQLHGNYITLFWALESVLLIWLAQKSGIVLYRLVSVIITLLMGISLMMDWVHVYGYGTDASIILNKAFITGIVSSFSLLAVVLLLRKETETVKYLGIPFHPKNYSAVLKIGFIGLLYLTGMIELIYQYGKYYEKNTVIIIGVAYHMVFFSILNLLVKSDSNKPIQITNFILNYVNSALFVLAFSIIPISDFKENLCANYPTQIGFITHYISIAGAIFMAYRMYKLRNQKDSPIMNMNVLNSILCAMAIIYVSSAELILHVSKLLIQPLTLSYGDLNYLKMNEYAETKIHIIKVGFPILWGMLAFIFLFFGMKKQNKPFRVIALALLAITLVKLFTYDISNASEAGKIIAFIILGLVLLVISFMYQKIKALLIDEKEGTKKTEEIEGTKET